MRLLGILGVCLIAAVAVAQQSLTYERLTVGDCCAAVTLSATTYSPTDRPRDAPTWCDLEVQSGSVLYRLDGGAATTTSGMSLLPADPPRRLSAGDASRLSLMGYASATSAIVNVTCGR